jgi:uncharacterized membrane protein YkvA (DUF1232 family)
MIASTDILDPPKLLSFYDRLRERVVAAAGRRVPLLRRERMDVLLLAPDVFMLLVRLALDPRVPSSSRGLIAGALSYFILPVDLWPEAVLGLGGFVDDLALATAVLSTALGSELEPIAERYWSGSQSLRTALSAIARSANGLLGPGVRSRLRRVVRRLGGRSTELERVVAPGASEAVDWVESPLVEGAARHGRARAPLVKNFTSG